MSESIDLNTKRRHLLRAGALATIGAPLLGACAATGGPNRAPVAAPKGFVAAPAVRNGESWRYALVNRYNGQTTNTVTASVVTVEPELRVELVDQQGKTLSDEIYDKAWQVRQEPLYNETLVFDQPMPLLPSQLAVGKREQLHGSYRLAGSQMPHPWHVSIRAVGWERVEVPAGTFDTLRIERHIFFEHHDLFRTRSRRVDTLWYAPTVNRWVMREWTGYYREDPAPFGLASGWLEEREDAVRWILLEHRVAPVS